MQHETPGSDSQTMRKGSYEPTRRSPENAGRHKVFCIPPNSAVKENHHANDCHAGSCREKQGVKHLGLTSSDLFLDVPHRNT